MLFIPQTRVLVCLLCWDTYIWSRDEESEWGCGDHSDLPSSKDGESGSLLGNSMRNAWSQKNTLVHTDAAAGVSEHPHVTSNSSP